MTNNTRNFFDSWNVIFDNDGRPLVGKIEFCESNTTDKVLKSIYDKDGNVISNPIYCNVVPTTQIMLDVGDYTVNFYKYIGHGNMESDNNSTSWFRYKSILVKDNNIVENSESVNLSKCSSISELQNLTGMEDNDVCFVIGYNSINDGCPGRYFIWHSNGSETPDGGVIINSSHTTQGYWQMIIPEDYIDVRWYGDIPDISTTPSTKTSNSGARTKAAQAANRYGKNLYFPSSKETNTYGFYIFEGSNTVSVNKDIICDYGVRFVVNPNTSGTVVQCHEVQKCDKYLFISINSSTSIGGYKLVADWIKTSWLTGIGAPTSARVGYIIDKLQQPMSFTNSKIKIEKSSLGSHSIILNNCEMVECFKQIDRPCFLKNMTYDSSWFVDNYDINNLTIDNSVTILLDKCKSADDYITLKNRINQHNYGDLNEQEIHGKYLYSDCVIENFSGTVILAGDGTFEIHNAAITLQNIMSSNCTINFVDCWVNSTTADNYCNVFQLRRGSWTGSNLRIGNGGCFIENAEMNVNIYTSDNNVKIKDSELYKNLFVSNCTIDNCTIHSSISQRNVGSVIDFNLYNNKFVDNGYHNLSSSVENTVVNGKWLNNSSTVSSHFININRTNINPDESTHGYVYEGNHGPNVLQKYAKVYYQNMTVYPYNSGSESLPTDCLYFRIYSGVQVAIWCKGHPWEANFFSVGTTNIVKQMTINGFPGQYVDTIGSEYSGGGDRIDTSNDAPTFAFPTKWKPINTKQYEHKTVPFSNLEFVSGYRWKFTYAFPGSSGSWLYIVDDSDGVFGYGDKNFWTKNTSVAKKLWFYITLE